MTGTNVKDRIKEEPSARRIAVAMGENIFPGIPGKKRIGMKTDEMMAMEKRMGRTTSPAAPAISSFPIGMPFSHWWRSIFSAITIEASTIIPIPITIPPIDMRSAAM
jgi:hypothetical protein